MSPLPFLFPEHIVYDLGELRLREHLMCFRLVGAIKALAFSLCTSDPKI